ncbi:methyltransferase domain-containing protein [Candidatus Poribacteria bacterium]|nr:methyltransferase domain-containing protein [Candidatus Poribacteria bacterium]
MNEDYYSLVIDAFKKWAPYYDAFALPFYRARRAIVAAVTPRRGEKVLDVCTGTGAVALALARAGASVTGIDISEHMLERARCKRNAGTVRFLRMDATELMFPANEFDTATISFALHDMPSEIMRRTLAETHRVARSRLVVIDYGLPRRALLARICRFLITLYEGPYYVEFLKLDVAEIARREGWEIEKRDAALLGICQVLTFRMTEEKT